MNTNKNTINNSYLVVNGKSMIASVTSAKTGKTSKYGINSLLVKGNKKIGYKVWHFSTLAAKQEIYIPELDYKAIGTCPCKCIGCYGLTGCYLFPSTKARLALRTYIARENLDFCEKQINYEIKKNKVQYLRIHATGDFFSREYAAMWLRIIKNNPGVTFWTYTKTYGKDFDDILNAINECPNANIVKSVISGCGLNYGHISYILDTYYKLISQGEKPYICKCGIDKNEHCSNCTGCSNHKYVLFIEHSTEYKAEKDPLYIDIKKLIESQK